MLHNCAMHSVVLFAVFNAIFIRGCAEAYRVPLSVGELPAMRRDRANATHRDASNLLESFCLMK